MWRNAKLHGCGKYSSSGQCLLSNGNRQIDTAMTRNNPPAGNNADDLNNAGNDDFWENNGWESCNLNAPTHGRNVRSSGGRGLGLAALLADVVGALFVLTRVRDRRCL